MKVWVLDLVGYDARGGNAEVFATKDGAMRSVAYITTWDLLSDGALQEHRDNPWSEGDVHELREVEVGP